MPSSIPSEQDDTCNGRDDRERPAGHAQSPSREFSRTSTSLLDGLKSVDTTRWHRFIETFEPRIYRWCRRGGLDENEAADVAQEVFIAISHKINDFHRDRPGDSFHKWARAITTHKIKDFWRAQRPEERSQGGTAWLVRLQAIAERRDPSSSAGQQCLDPDDPRLVAIERVRADVVERDWVIFERTVMDEQAPADVAQEFDVSVNTVYLAKSRILKRVRACFAEDGEDQT